MSSCRCVRHSDGDPAGCGMRVKGTHVLRDGPHAGGTTVE